MSQDFTNVRQEEGSLDAAATVSEASRSHSCGRMGIALGIHHG